MDILAKLIVHQRGLIAVAVVVATLISVPGVTRVSFDEDPQVFFRRESRDLQLLEQLGEEFGPDTNDVAIVVRTDDVFTATSIQTLRELASRVTQLEDVEYAWSLARIKRSGTLIVPLLPYSDFSQERLQRARELALRHPLVAGHLVSPDATMTLILARLAGTKLELGRAQRVVRELQTICDEFSRDSRFDARPSGAATIAVESFAHAKTEVIRIALLSVVFSVAIASALFRHWVPTLIAVMGPTVGVVWTLGVMGYTGHNISGVTTILPTLLFVVGFADSIHLILESRRTVTAGSSPDVAAQTSIQKVGLACLLTSLTSAVGFGSLMLAETEGVRQFGATCSFGAVLTFVSVITVVPILLSAGLTKQLRRRWQGNTRRLPPRWASRPLTLVVRYHRSISVLGILLTLTLLVSTTHLRPDISMTEGIPLDSETRRVVRDCDQAFGGSLHASIVVQWPQEHRLASTTVLGLVDRIHQTLNDEQYTRHPMSILNVLESLPGRGDNLARRARHLRRLPENMRNRFLRLDMRKLLITAQVPDVGGAALEPAFDRLERKFQSLQQEFPGFDISLTGAPVVSARNVKHMIQDLTTSLLFAAAVILVIITGAFRSVRLGIISAIPNVFPLVVAAGLLVVTSQPLRLASAIAFTLCLGLAVDDTIHFLVRFRQQERLGKTVDRAVRSAYYGVGSAIVTTTLVFTGGFSAMFVSVVPSILIFAEISCVAILAALVGDLILLPALLLWWRKPGEDTWRAADNGGVGR